MKTTKVTRALRHNGIAVQVAVTVLEPAGTGWIMLVAEPLTDSSYPEYRTGQATLFQPATTLTLMPEAGLNGLDFMVVDETHPFVFTDMPFYSASFANSPAEYRATLRAIAERFAFDAAIHAVESL